MRTIYKSAWIHIKDRKVLFLRAHGKDIPYMPGGKREAGESDEDALVREIKEELSLDLLPETIKLTKRSLLRRTASLNRRCLR